jgi:hypothetical protein
MKLRKMTPEEIAEYKRQKEQEYTDYVPPILTEEDLQEMRDREEEDYYVSDMTAKEQEAIEKEVHEAYEQHLIEEEERKEQLKKYAEKGIKFSQGKALGAKLKSTLHIEELVKRNPNLTAKQLFKLADPRLIGKMSLGTFQNHVSKIKNNQK